MGDTDSAEVGETEEPARRCSLRPPRPVEYLSAGPSQFLLPRRHAAANPRARVVDVLDGDTIVVAFADGTTDTIRVLGVGTPI